MEKIILIKDICYDYDCPVCNRSREIYPAKSPQAGETFKCTYCNREYEIKNVEDQSEHTKTSDIREALVELRDEYKTEFKEQLKRYQKTNDDLAWGECKVLEDIETDLNNILTKLGE